MDLEIKSTDSVPNKGGAPEGNKNAAKGKVWNDALRKAIAQNPHKVREAVEQLLELAANGEAWAIKELADRLDGKPMQSTEISAAEGTEIKGIMLGFVEGNANPT